MLPRVSPNAMVRQTVGVTPITISYGRPSVRDREVFGELVPYGEVWRTGANEATAITFAHDVQVEGHPLEAGTYGLFTIPRRSGEWTLIFNEVANQWGAFEYDSAEDALRVPVPAFEADFREMLTFNFTHVSDTSAQIVLRWDTVAVPFEVRVNTEAAVHSLAEELIPEAENWEMPYNFANYFLERRRHLEDALFWADTALRMNENYRTMALKARIYARLNQYEHAVRVGERAVRMGQSEEEEPQDLRELKNQLASWRSRV